MSKKRVLIVTQEMSPYTALSEISEIANKLPLYLQDNNVEIRVLMPRFGTVNERRHRLHEVVRLSGMNIIVNDDDFPLIIKVASLPGARLQVYFLDNDEFFRRKSVFTDDEGHAFNDNIDRMVFFCKGAIEIVKKFGWAPDIVHCHGWMTAMIPLYLKVAYRTEPLFQNSKIVYSVYDDDLATVVDNEFMDKASINNLKAEDLIAFQSGENISIHKGAAAFSDGLIMGSEIIQSNVLEELEAMEKPTLEYKGIDGFEPYYVDFYDTLMSVEV